MNTVANTNVVVIEHIEQHDADGTTNPNWLAWRQTRFQDDLPRITATAAVAAVGASEYQTRYELWCAFVGVPLPPRAENKGSDFAKKRGLESEAAARASLAQLLQMPPGSIPACLVSNPGEQSWIAASLDGAIIEDDQVLATAEYKLNGKPRHDLAQMGVVPRDHMLQMQWQMFAAKAKQGYYVSTPFAGGVPLVIEVNADLTTQEWLVEEVQKFRVCCATSSRRPPPDMEPCDPTLKDIAWEYHQALLEKATADAKAEAASAVLMAAIKARTGNDKFVGLGVVAELKQGSGSVQWAKVVKDHLPNLTDEDLFKYTKAAPAAKFSLTVSAEAPGFLAAQRFERWRAEMTALGSSAPEEAFTDW